jgi:hypothetical protein
MSHLRSTCANCGASKDDLYEPYCLNCNIAVQGVREYAKKNEIGRDLFNKMKDDALNVRRTAVGMGSKMRPDGSFERAPNPAEVQEAIADQVRTQEEEMLDLRKRFGV